jgi:hypothetical protein
MHRIISTGNHYLNEVPFIVNSLPLVIRTHGHRHCACSRRAISMPPAAQEILGVLIALVPWLLQFAAVRQEDGKSIFSLLPK